jgi:hypothetical protein
VWHAALGRAEVRDRRMYKCKATFISTALSEGAPPLWVKDVTGVSRATVSKRYARWMPGQTDGARFAARLRGEPVAGASGPGPRAPPITPPLSLHGPTRHVRAWGAAASPLRPPYRESFDFCKSYTLARLR